MEFRDFCSYKQEFFLEFWGEEVYSMNHSKYNCFHDVLKVSAKIQGNHLQKSVISVKLQAEDKQFQLFYKHLQKRQNFEDLLLNDKANGNDATPHTHIHQSMNFA